MNFWVEWPVLSSRLPLKARANDLLSGVPVPVPVVLPCDVKIEITGLCRQLLLTVVSSFCSLVCLNAIDMKRVSRQLTAES